jgi:hypothetical protein
MFFQFANWNSNVLSGKPTQAQIEALMRVHPQVFVNALEHFYATRKQNPGEPNYASPVLPTGYGGAGSPLENMIQSVVPIDQRWDHLIYAYMVENTRIFEIFDRVLREFEAGEKFETPDPDTALWLRTTEALFYRDQNPGFIGSLTSWLRPDQRATRRNSYYRLLGLDLNHGVDGNRAYQFDKPAASNREFVPAFEALVREVWRGMVNASNTSGANDTDNAAIANHARRLKEMLNLRRNNGNLLREEFWAVTALSWFHLAVAEDTPVVRALKADAESPGDRLRKLGITVGVPAHNQSDAYFNLAGPLSEVLTFIETSPLAVQPSSAPGYYAPSPGTPWLPAAMRTIINYWSVATGRDLKGLSTSATPILISPAGNGNGKAMAVTR